MGILDMRVFPHYKQLDSMACGATCLRMIGRFYGRSFGVSQLQEQCHTGHLGVSMLGISDAAESIGFRTLGVKLTFEQLCEEVPLPCILHWNQNHFVVLYDIRKKKNSSLFLVGDPAAEGILKYRQSAFEKCWLSAQAADGKRIGTALLMEPTPRFYTTKAATATREDGDRLRFRFLLRYLHPYRRFMIQLLFGLLTGSIISLIFPFLTQSMVDTGIGNSDLSFVVAILVAQLMLTVGQSANNLIRNWVMLHLTTRLSISLISDFLAKLMRLPIAFFDAKRIGDIMQRIDDHHRIQSFLTGTLISLLIASITFVVYSTIMAGYDWVILGIFLLGSVLYVLWILLFLKRRRQIDHMRFQEAALNQSTIVQLVSGMQDIKLNNCEKQKRWTWENVQVKLYKISIKGLTLQQTQQVGSLFIDQSKNILISYLAASYVISGGMTLGMMMALQYIIGQLNGTVSQFIGFVQESQDAKISLERLGEIHARKDEEPASEAKRQVIPEGENLVLENVSFQYEGPHSEKVLDGVNLTVETGKITAIVGASGSGKTTLLKLLLGFYTPTNGRVLLGRVPLAQYSDSAWRSCCGVVMQEGFIFSDSIAGNIGLTDANPDMDRVRQAARIANIETFIESLPLGYHTKIGIDGHGLSTGQKQRILVARAAYKNAPYLMLDEATNSLDAINERMIMEKLDRLFEHKTVIIVAHRLSTVQRADKIVVLNHGRVIEQGTHRELTARKGYYYRLVRDQLALGN